MGNDGRYRKVPRMSCSGNEVSAQGQRGSSKWNQKLPKHPNLALPHLRIILPGLGPIGKDDSTRHFVTLAELDFAVP